MAYLDPQDAFQHFRDRVFEGIRGQFPLQGKNQTLHLEDLEAKDNLQSDDIRGQHQAKVKGESWTVPVYGKIVLKDNLTGKTVDTQRIRLAEIPKMTKRYSYIVDGQEYQIDNQWQLKPGIYTRRGQSGELESQVNVTGRPSFDIVFDPHTKKFIMTGGEGKGKLPLYPIMKVLGVDDDALEKAWGKEAFEANKTARGVATVAERFYKAEKKQPAPSPEEAKKYLYEAMTAGKLRPESTQITLGKAFDHVDGEALRLATEKILKVQAGHPEDDRDSLIFKNLRTSGDYAFDRIRNNGATLRQKVSRKINTANNIRDILKFDFFNEPVKGTFTQSGGISRTASQINPVEMLGSSFQTTITGPGGIQGEHSIVEEVKFVNPSHLGFLDPIHTPEGAKTGVTLRLPIGVKKEGEEPKIRLFNLRTKKFELVGPGKMMTSTVVLPDQVRWEKDSPKPISPTVKMRVGGEIKEGKFEDAEYSLRYPSQLFNSTSNLIPFLGNTNGNRASMASRQIEQAISLMHRDAPLVQVSTEIPHRGIDTFEGLLGRQASHLSPVDGVITDVKKDAIEVQSHAGPKHEVQLYNNYPLNDPKSVLHSTPLVKVGDHVHANQPIADTNFSRKGTLALGTNLRVAYLPYKGYNFEDGIVISKSAAEKLSSEHLHKPSLAIDPDMVLDTRKFDISHPTTFTSDQLKPMSTDGVVKVGTRVKPGDPLVLALKPFLLKDRTGVAAIRRNMAATHTDKSLRWDSDFEGEVTSVHKNNKEITVHVRTVEPMQVGDKMAGRYGNKGIVTQILEDHEMPHTKDGKHIEVALNPSGVPGRMNVGQVLETAAGKIAQKTGKPYIVHNFAPDTDVLSKIKKELKEHGLSDTEELIDPLSKHSLGQVMVGPQHLLKLVHQVDKKLSVRSGMAGDHYDINLEPTGGGGSGGQSMGTLGMYALLAHGAKANIREMQTWKSEGEDPQTNEGKKWKSQHNQVWTAIQTGGALPTPRPTFAFQKFTDYLRGTGVNVEKRGHAFILSPMTDKQILSLSAGALPKPTEILEAKGRKGAVDPRPRPGGLFDEKLTGGHGGRKWSHIDLAEPIPNPIFESAISKLTELSKKQFQSIVSGEMGVSPAGKIVDNKSGVTGGAGIKLLLDKIDVKRDLPAAKKELTNAKPARIDQLFKKVKYLQALEKAKLQPSEAYLLHHLPVIPPVMRPISMLQTGDIKYDDLNGLYSEFAQVNDKLKDSFLNKNLSDDLKKNLRKNLYDGVKAIMGLGVPYDDAKQKGIIHKISGSNPKSGYFQDTIMNRRQDLTMRSTIVPEPALALDEVGLPRVAALELFRPFVVRKLKEMGAAPTTADALKVLEKQGPSVWKALEKVVEDRPVLMKRDPALHKFSVQAFKPKLVSGNAIQIHPLVTGGYTADFDGDTMSIFVPISPEAVAEAHKMFPSNNLFNEATGKVMYQPTLESALGLYKLSLSGKDTGKKYAHPGAVIDAVRKGDIHATDIVHLGEKRTTAGRILLSAAVPEAMQQDLLHNLDSRINKKGLDSLFTTLAEKHPKDFAEAANRLKDLGNGAAFGVAEVPRPLSAGHPFVFDKAGKTADLQKPITVPIGAHTLNLEDFTPDAKMRDEILGEAQKKVHALNNSTVVPKADKERQAIEIWSTAENKMQKQHESAAEKDPSNLFTMYKAGVKPGWSQYKQMVLAPMLLQDSAGKTIPIPVTKSYSEGLDTAGYWTQMHGARRGSVMKVQEVQKPGYESKLLMNTMLDMIVNHNDCGTKKGIALSVDEPDIHDRYLAEDFRHGHIHVPAGQLLTPDILGHIKAAKKDARLVVRSPLKCEEEHGLCQKCTGLSASGDVHPLGTNVGVLSAHAVGERAVQLSLKAFHTGGVREQSGGKLLNSFARFEQLTHMPKKLPNSSTLAMVGGTIDKMEKDQTGTKVWINGHEHHVGRDAAGMPLHEPLPHAIKAEGYIGWSPPVVGGHIEAGQTLSDPNRTFVNPHDLYAATKSIEKVQNFLTSEIHDLYKEENVRRRNVETLVKAMSNLTKVVDPGDSDMLRGEFRPTSVVRKVNADLEKQKKQLIEHKPVLKSVQMLPLSLQEDWMAKLNQERLKETILEAASRGDASLIHGTHPVPGIAYGAEFGMTKAKALTPGLEHLKDVQEHHY